VDVLGVDPATFASAAYWRGSFASSSLAGLLGRLGASSPDRLNVIAAGAVPAHSTLVMSQSGLAIKVVGSAGTFPGMSGTRPMIVVDTAALQRAAASRHIGLVGLGVHYQAWSPAPPDRVIPVLRAGHAVPSDVQTAARFMRTPSFLALSWTFGFLAALGSLAGILAVIGLLLYLQARQRSREVAYALSRRMGLRSGAHRFSVVAELAGMLGCAFVIGTGLAAAASMLVYRRLDPLPQLPPSPLFRLPLVLLALLAAGLCVVTWTGAAAVHRQAERVDVSEVMRLAE
jgi:putative ABC transport system permease protein